MDKMEYGFPVVNADNVFEVLRECGVKELEQFAPTVSLEEYLERSLTEEQKKELKFTPLTEVVFLRTPDGKSFTGFRNSRKRGKHGTTTFALLPGDLVPLVGEFKHGAESISLLPPGGVPNAEDSATNDPLAACAKREFEDETGILLERVELLSSDFGLTIAPAHNTQRNYPFLGYIAEPVIVTAPKFDDTEFLQVVLMPVTEVIRLCDDKKARDSFLVNNTFLALRKLGRLCVI